MWDVCRNEDESLIIPKSLSFNGCITSTHNLICRMLKLYKTCRNAPFISHVSCIWNVKPTQPLSWCMLHTNKSFSLNNAWCWNGNHFQKNTFWWKTAVSTEHIYVNFQEIQQLEIDFCITWREHIVLVIRANSYAERIVLHKYGCFVETKFCMCHIMNTSTTKQRKPFYCICKHKWIATHLST